MLFYGTASVFAHLTGFVGMVQQIADGLGQLVNIIRLYAQAEVILVHHPFIISRARQKHRNAQRHVLVDLGGQIIILIILAYI